MTSFSAELSERLTSHEVFWDYFKRLSGTSVSATLSKEVVRSYAPPDASEVAKLLYCANIFVQTEDERLKGLAQAIALNALMVTESGSTREQCLRLLTELGNFPGLKFAEEHFGFGDDSLLGLINRRVSQALNTVTFGPLQLALTDYQKRVWDALPTTKALALSAPTSAGKSFLVVEHMCRLAEKGQPFAAVYIAPTRALLSEVHQKVQLRLAGVVGVRISSVPSLDATGAISQVFILTQERLHVLLSIADFAFDLIVVDEAQNVSEGARGMILHDCLETVLRRNLKAQVILLAPGAEGLPEVAKTFGVSDLTTAYTSLSPVLQNRIVVSKVKGVDQLTLDLLGLRGERYSIGLVSSERGLSNERTRLAAIALELGGEDGSLVYAKGPSDAEKVATQLMNGLPVSNDLSLKDLAGFVQEHIHPEYRLATMIRHGVAFHYGRMPSLLREALEASFKEKTSGLKFLACTTTLFQGVNLPARNVFINTPTRGTKKDKLDPALLWNFAGRAGRLGKDMVGNVFLVDYDEWGSQPMDVPARFQVSSAISDVLASSLNDVMQALDGHMPVVLPWLDKPTKIRACAGLLMAKAAKGDARAFIARVLPPEHAAELEELAMAAERAVEKVSLPVEILEANWTIDPFGLRRLYDRMVEKIVAGEVDELIPLNPHEVKVEHYAGIFRRILREVFGNKGNFGALVASLAIPWMRGVPYPVILANWISYRQRAAAKKAEVSQQSADGQATNKTRTARATEGVDTFIRDAFNLIEDVVRFQFVQLGKAYLDLLTLALRENGLEDEVSKMFDFSLALELGVATTTGTSFVELGLSRIAASALEGLFPDSNLTTVAARQALGQLDAKASNLSPVIFGELQRLGLVSEPVAPLQ